MGYLYVDVPALQWLHGDDVGHGGNVSHVHGLAEEYLGDDGGLGEEVVHADVRHAAGT